MSDLRLYVVQPTKALGADAPARLIKAKSQASALKFATSEFYSVELADAETAAELAGKGAKIEVAADPS